MKTVSLAAESLEDRQTWLVKLARVSTTLALYICRPVFFISLYICLPVFFSTPTGRIVIGILCVMAQTMQLLSSAFTSRMSSAIW